MIKANKALVASTIITAAILSACGGSNAKKVTPAPTPAPTPVKLYKAVECKSMLSANQLALLTTDSSCGYLSVPEKHALYGQAASTKKIEIAVIKLATVAKDKTADPVVYLQGGPGGSASESIQQVVESGTFIKSRDVYLVDQRGTGYSKPALSCTEYSGEAGTPAQVTACKARLEKTGVDLNAYHSVHSALDFIQLRKSLNISQWNLYGISYGTRLATTIMRENSEGIRSVILDGMFPIEVNGITDTPWANYETLNQIVKNCESSEGCPADEFKEIIEGVITRMHNESMVTESRVFVQNVLELATQPVMIKYLLAVNEDISKYQSAFEALMAGGESETEDKKDKQNEEEEVFYSAMALSTICAEEYPFLNITALTGDNSAGWSASTQLAVNGMYHMGFDKASCKAWNVTAANDIETQAVTSNLPVLIINGLNDTQTPAAWGALVAKNMPNAQNLTNPQGGHGQLFAESACFNALAEGFLTNPNQTLDAQCVLNIPSISYGDEDGGGDNENPAAFTFKDDDDTSATVYMNGVIGSNTLEVMKALFNKYPQIKTVVMKNVPGSMDDDVNLLASMEIRNRGIATHIPADGMVASGGTDMFLAGVKRTIETGAKIGVHSWSDGSGKAALDYPRDHQEHVKYLEYYKAIGITTDFYWYTLEAATADSIHWMTEQEIGTYNMLTE